ncbi:MAG: aminotransferase class V-fold PLP-dependent enzyme [Candidatus Zixiibacteriota bacterium]
MKRSSQIDLKKYRKEFPHTNKITYLNHASWTPLPQRSVRAAEKFMEYATLKRTGDVDKLGFDFLDDNRKKIARMIHTKTSEIGFAFNTSYGLNIAAQGLDLRPKDTVLLPDVEFPANVYPWLNLKRKGVKIKFIRSRHGFFDMNEFRKSIDKRTKVLSISFVQFHNGFKNDLETIGKICQENDIFFVVDAIQGIGVLDLYVKKAKIDLLSCGGPKWLCSVLGHGFFYYSKEAKRKLDPVFFGWMGVDWKLNFTDLLKFDLKPFPDARQFTTGSYPYESIITMNTSLGMLLEIGIPKIQIHTLHLLDILIDYLKDSPYQITSCLEPRHRSSILSFSGKNSRALYQKLCKKNIIVSYRENAIRVSPHFYNTKEEIKRLIEVLRKNE